MLALLFKQGLSPSITDREGLTIMHHAARAGQAGLLQQLLAANIRANVEDKRGRTPSFYAEQAGHADCAKLLKEAEEKEDFHFTMPR